MYDAQKACIDLHVEEMVGTEVFIGGARLRACKHAVLVGGREVHVTIVHPGDADDSQHLCQR